MDLQVLYRCLPINTESLTSQIHPDLFNDTCKPVQSLIYINSRIENLKKNWVSVSIKKVRWTLTQAHPHEANLPRAKRIRSCTPVSSQIFIITLQKDSRKSEWEPEETKKRREGRWDMRTWSTLSECEQLWPMESNIDERRTKAKWRSTWCHAVEDS